MVRKTKEEALETRTRILETAEQIFSEQGVSHTSLQDIAAAANVTRGAIYWHFKNKTDLLDAMLQRVKMPIEDALERSCDPNSPDPLGQLCRSAVDALQMVSEGDSAQRVCEILLFKCEYVAETADLRRHHIESRKIALARYEEGFRRAIELGQLPSHADARTAAIGLHSIMHGLFMDWMLDPDEFDLTKVGTQVIEDFLDGLRQRPPRV
ncbi:HTH-type transcriptional regulator TtgR [Pigmentiphaga humi]|uniref:HTH-type transcriptional regulator TtgR n=1 Tax=Pigmentiphaga humi TaxID=2478468 RepID=A0A3P4BA98_9BURK|nr:TetR family transcriptional regulator [Pigmentiphaga humi]VCU72550.1 HTH-type transcriptional regulator TtgR [Pigmentiphaga humi]